MNILKEKDTKLILIISLIIILAFSILFTIISKVEQKEYTEIINNKINVIVNNVIQNYPKINEKDVINILNNKENKLNKDILKKYGYGNDVIYIKQLENKMNMSNLISISLLIFSSLILLSLFIIYILKENKKIDKINSYIKSINNRNYSLDIQSNEEGELSKLKNELYKITVNLKESEQISRKEKEQLSDSLTDISHQLKTPLTSIRIMLDNIEDNPNMDEITKKEFLKEISKQIDWISSLVISLLKIAKFDAGSIQLERKETNVNKLINNVINNLSIILDIKNINVICNIQDEIKFVCDYKWELEALTNILKNCIEHSKEGSNIYIDIDNNSLFLVIKIRDEGEGIDKEDLNHIFERFYKAKNSSNSSIGIGLSLAKAIIEKDNGYIDVESKINEGTIFYIKYLK